MLEGVVLQQTRGNDFHPSQGNAQQQDHDGVLVHPKNQPDGRPKRRKRGSSKDTKKVYTDTFLKAECDVINEEPRKVCETFEKLDSRVRYGNICCPLHMQQCSLRVSCLTTPTVSAGRTELTRATYSGSMHRPIRRNGLAWSILMVETSCE